MNVALEKEINRYIQSVSLDILKDYKKSLGDANIFLLTQIVNNKFATFSKDSAIPLSIPKNITSYEIAFNDLKSKIPRQLFSLFIQPKKKEFEMIDEEFAKDLTEGLISIYVKDFCSRHHYIMEKKESKESESIANVLLSMRENGVNKDAMVFQTSYSYMLQIYSITEKKNLIDLYHETYLSQKKLRKMKQILNAYFQEENLYKYYSIHNTTSFIQKDLKEQMENKYSKEEQNRIFKELNPIFAVKQVEELKTTKKNGFLKSYLFFFLTMTFGIFLTWLFFLK